MYALNITETQQFIRHVCVTHKEAAMVWGPPGVGKSQGIAQLAAELDARLVDIRLSQFDSVDLRGIPSPDAATQQTVWYAPSVLPFVGNPAFDANVPGSTAQPDQPILLFLDEINSASAAVSAVAYQLINDRCVGEHRLLPSVIVVAAGNREGDRGVTNRMPLPLANRLTHVEVVVDVDDWCFQYAQQAGLPPVGIAFLQFRKPLLMTFDPSQPAKAFATPRTWEKALRYYADPAMPDKIKQAAITGAVGDGPATEFAGFVDVWAKIPPMADIIKRPDKTRVADEASMRYAVAVACSGAMTLDTADPIHTYLMRMDPEFAVLAWKLATARNTTLFHCATFQRFTQDCGVLFTA